jgi:hypothetical protein
MAVSQVRGPEQPGQAGERETVRRSHRQAHQEKEGKYSFQYSGSKTFWCGSGSADPCLSLMDPDPAIFVIEIQDANKKLILKKMFFCLLLFAGTFT